MPTAVATHTVFLAVANSICHAARRGPRGLFASDGQVDSCAKRIAVLDSRRPGYASWRQAKTGILTKLSRMPKTIAAVSSKANTLIEREDIAIPRFARTEMNRMSANEEAISRPVGRIAQNCRRSRMAYVIAWLPYTMAMTLKVWMCVRSRPILNCPIASTQLRNHREHAPRIALAAVILPMSQ
jgi:hypothetical protein